MKKSMVKALSALFAVILLLSVLPIMAFATVNSTFFRTDCSGFRCTGNGSLSSTTASAVFNATAIPLEPVPPADHCSSEIQILTYNSAGEYMGAATSTGTTYATVTCTPSGIIAEAGYSFEFMGADLGVYLLENT